MRTIFAVMILGLPASLLAAEFTVLDGAAQAIIVYDRDARGESVRAYQDLARCLKLATGKAFEVVSERDLAPERKGGPIIYVGACNATPFEDRRELRKIDRDAFLVHVTPNAAYLVGPRPWSTYWAVCQFLEDYVGVRWLIPGPLGEDVPHHDGLAVPCGRCVHAPRMLSRLWSGAGHGGPWSLRRRIHARYRFHHNLLRVFNPELYYDEHPEWYPLRDGERYRPGKNDHSWQPCVASESSVKHAADAARAAWAKNPDLESFSYGPNDSRGWCECEACKALDRPIEPWGGFEGTHSYRFYGWMNKVAAELEATDPDKMLGCLAYSTYILPPDDMPLHENIIPYLTSNRADYWEPIFKRQDQALLERWGRVANQMGIYDYAYGMGFAIPRIYNHLFQDAIQHAVKHGVRGFYAEVYPNWGLDGPKLYVMSAILWDPHVNIDALTDEWNERMFRESAGPMKRYFARCERAWREQKTGRGHWAYRLAAKPKQFEIFPPEILAECTGYLDEAAALAESDLVKQRIHFFRKTWDITLLLAGAYWAARDVQGLTDADASVEQVAAAVRRMTDRIATTDIGAYMKEKVGDDPVAFYPPKASWIAPLKAGAATNAKRWSAARIAESAVKNARDSGTIDAAQIRKQISAQVDDIFGAEGSEAYLTAVAQIRAMALKVATIVRADPPPEIDGVLDDTVWRRADEMTGFAKHGEVSPAEHVTKTWLAHDGENLYVALECIQDTSNLRVQAGSRDGRTWDDDSIEFFINPAMSEFPYIQFIINAKGAFFDQWGRNDQQSYPQRLAANFNCDWRARIEEGRWTAEMRLPLGEFGCLPQSHPLLRVDVMRNVQGKDAETSAWFPSIGAHADPLTRGWVIFE